METGFQYGEVFPLCVRRASKYLGRIQRDSLARRQDRAPFDPGISHKFGGLHRNVSGIAPGVIEHFNADVSLNPGGPKEAGLLDDVDLPALEEHHSARTGIERVRFHALFGIRHRVPIERRRTRDLE